MPGNHKTSSGEWWQRQASGAYALFTNGTARRVICEGAGNLYLVPVGSTSAGGTLFFTGAVAGQAFDVQCDGIGTSTTCSAVIGQG